MWGEQHKNNQFLLVFLLSVRRGGAFGPLQYSGDPPRTKTSQKVDDKLNFLKTPKKPNSTSSQLKQSKDEPIADQTP